MSTVLGIKIDQVSFDGALRQADDFLSGSTQKKIFTPNPEMLVKAQTDPYFKEVLNSGDLNLCDGFGLWMGARFQSRNITLSSRGSSHDRPRAANSSSGGAEISVGEHGKTEIPSVVGMTKDNFERITGVDFMVELCGLAERQGKSVYLLGGAVDDVVNKTAEKLREKFPKLRIVGKDKGPEIGEVDKRQQTTARPFRFASASGRARPHDLRQRVGQVSRRELADKENNGEIEKDNNDSGIVVDAQENNNLIDTIKAAQPDILFVAFGMGKQEKWIHENIAKLPSVKIAMGVGGSFDYISGQTSRAPLLLRKIGLEWAYRLYKQPRRFGRIWNATAKFIFYFFIFTSTKK